MISFFNNMFQFIYITFNQIYTSIFGAVSGAINSFYEIFIKNGGMHLMFVGLWNTLIMVPPALAIGVVLGTLLAIVKVLSTEKSNGLLKFLNVFVSAYLTFFRGTPVVVQLVFLYFGILGPLHIPAIPVAIFVFGLNSAAYVTEIIRSGILSVDKGQMEAGRSLGFTYGTTMKKIILPQAIKNMIPALGNEFITLIKETAVASYITVFDMMRASGSIVSKTYETFIPYLVLALMYLALVLIATFLVNMIERRLRKSDNR